MAGTLSASTGQLITHRSTSEEAQQYPLLDHMCERVSVCVLWSSVLLYCLLPGNIRHLISGI